MSSYEGSTYRLLNEEEEKQELNLQALILPRSQLL